jgi:hypothetical protein
LIPQWLLSLPQPAFFISQQSDRQYITSILATNLVCVFLHLFLAAPEAGEATREYLHGGFLIDFVGEPGPVSKLRMLLIDLSVLVLQIVILAAVMERKQLRFAIDHPSWMELIERVGRSFVRQDLDAEEQGIRRSQEALVDFAQSLSLETEQIDRDAGASIQKDEHHLDISYSGQMVILDLYIRETLRKAWKKRYGLLNGISGMR